MLSVRLLSQAISVLSSGTALTADGSVVTRREPKERMDAVPKAEVDAAPEKAPQEDTEDTEEDESDRGRYMRAVQNAKFYQMEDVLPETILIEKTVEGNVLPDGSVLLEEEEEGGVFELEEDEGDAAHDGEEDHEPDEGGDGEECGVGEDGGEGRDVRDDGRHVLRDGVEAHLDLGGEEAQGELPLLTRCLQVRLRSLVGSKSFQCGSGISEP